MPRVRRRSRSKFRRVRQSLSVSGTVNYERRWQLMLSFDEFNGPKHSVDAVAEAIGPCCSDDLYRLYRDVPRQQPRLP